MSNPHIKSPILRKMYAQELNSVRHIRHTAQINHDELCIMRGTIDSVYRRVEMNLFVEVKPESPLAKIKA